MLNYSPLILGSLVLVEGSYGSEFLQNVTTGNFDRDSLDKGKEAGEVFSKNALYCALLTPQAKIIADMFCLSIGQNRYLLIIHKELAEEIIKLLRLYGRRRDVKINQTDEYKIKLNFVNNANIMMSFADPRIAGFFNYHLCNAEKVTHNIKEEIIDYNQKRLMAGLAETICEYPSKKLFAHEANLDRLNALDLHKGCYIGQEIISRLHHSEKIGKRLFRFTIVSGYVKAGEPVYYLAKKIGEVISVVSDKTCFILIRFANLGYDFKIDGQIFDSENASLCCSLADWMKSKNLALMTSNN